MEYSSSFSQYAGNAHIFHDHHYVTLDLSTLYHTIDDNMSTILSADPNFGQLYYGNEVVFQER